jgi:hypothetical protein
MRMSSRFVLEGGVLVLLIAVAGCTKPSTDNGTGTGGSSSGSSGGSSGSATGGQTGATGGSTGSGGARTTGTGGSATTSTGGSPTTGTGGSAATGTGGTTTGATGGTTGAGGMTGGGTGGAAGATVVQKDCATKTKIMSPLFMDFENYNGTVTAANYATAFGGTTVNTGTAYAGIYPYPESAGSTTPTLAILAGHPPSNWAGSETLQATQWGMGGGVWMGCADATAYKGISFWVRGSSGTGMFSFTVSMESTQLPDATNPAGGGTCPGTTDTCKDPIKSNIPITSDWTQVQILWSDFTTGMSGTTSVVPNGDNIAGMAWTVPLQFHLDPSVSADAAGPYIPIPGAVSINIDDISFIQ